MNHAYNASNRRKEAITVVDSQGREGYICDYGYFHPYEPNAQMLEAMEETEKILRDPNRKRYSTFAELLADLDAEDDDEIQD